MEGDFSDFRLDPDLLDVIKILLEQGMSYAAIGKSVDVDPRTVKRIDLRMKEIRGEEVDKAREKEEIKYVPVVKYQRLLKRVQELEGWRNNEYVKEYNNLRNYVAETVVPHIDYLRDSDRSQSERIVTNTMDIEHLQYDVNLIKEIRKLEIAKFMEKSRKRRAERDRAEEESSKRIVETMEEEERKRKQVPVDTFFKKLEEINGKKSY